MLALFTRISLLAARVSASQATGEAVLARHERNIRAAGKDPLSLSELLSLIGEPKEQADRERHDAIACYLSASEGWAEAVQQLGGAFAEDSRKLKGRKAD